MPSALYILKSNFIKMDLIRLYHDHDTQSSNSSEEVTIVKKEIAIDVAKSRIPRKIEYFREHKVPNGRLLHRHIDKTHQNITNFSVWLNDIDKRLHSCLGSVSVLQKNTILESMDYFISKLTKDYEKLIKPKIAETLSNYIRTYLCVYKYLYRSYEMGKRYFKRIIKILTIYTDLELCASLRGTEYDSVIAERIQMMYQIHLVCADKEMALDVLVNTKRLWRRHRGILNLLLEHILIKNQPVELSDNLFIKNLIIFKKWLYIEEIAEDQNNIREAFIKFIKPKKTLCMNSLFKPYLPVDNEGFVTIDNVAAILDMECSLGLLARSLRKAEETSDLQSQEVVIVLTDDEEDESLHRLESNSHNHEYSNDFDCISSISTQSTHASNDIHLIETLSIDTPPYKGSPSRKSIDSITGSINSNTILSSVDQNNVETNSESSIEKLSENVVNNNITNITIDLLCDNLEKDCVKIPSLDQSTFNKLVRNLNETQISDSFSTNVESPESIEIVHNNDQKICETTKTRHEMSCQTTISVPVHGCSKNSLKFPRTSSEMAELFSYDSGVADSKNESDNKTNTENNQINQLPSDNCDISMNSISSSPFKSHQETLLNIEEIISADIDKSQNTDKITKEIDVHVANPLSIETDSVPKNSCNAITENIVVTPITNCTVSSNRSKTVSNATLNETTLLSKSVQNFLLQDDNDEFLNDIFSWGNDSLRESSPKMVIGAHKANNKSDRLSSSSVKSFFRNSIDKSNAPKTYSKIRSSKVAHDKNLLDKTSSDTPKQIINEEDSFLMDIFCSKHIRDRLSDSKKTINDNVYCSSTPKPSTSRINLTGNRKIANDSNKSKATPKKGRKKREELNETRRANGNISESEIGLEVPSKNATKKKMVKKEKNKQNSPDKTTKKERKPRTKQTKLSVPKKRKMAMPSTILTRQTYIKPLNSQNTCDNSLNNSNNLSQNKSFYTTFYRRPNGKCSLNSDDSVPSTILERKTYVKDSTLHSLSMHNLSTSRQHDSFSRNTSGSSNNNYSCENNVKANINYQLTVEPMRFGSVVSNDSADSEYVKNVFASNIGSSKGIRNPMPTIRTVLNVSKETDNKLLPPTKKKHKISSDYSDGTNEFESGHDSNVDDLDGSTGYNTRKSNRSRKKPKKLDL